MHSGFGALRSAFGMNIEARCPRSARAAAPSSPTCARDLDRIDAMWSEALDASGGPVPVRRASASPTPSSRRCAPRIRTYALPLAPRSAEYVERMLALPALQAWEREALAEHDFIPEDEPYRTRA